jgi:UDP-glucose:(heptosyl)LPS alpha-1,3-glucosyltransferase
MKVALVVERFDPRRGGLEQWSARFAAELARRGHEVHVVAERFSAAAEKLPLVRHVLGPTGTRLGFAAAAERALDRLAVDVVHDTGAGWRCDVFQPHCGSRAAAIEHNLLLMPGWMRPCKRQLSAWLPRYRNYAALMRHQYVVDGRIFLAISQQVAADFQYYHGIPEHAIRVVYNGIDTEQFSPVQRASHRQPVREWLGVADHEVLLLIVAHNFQLKGVPALLEATGRLARRGWPVRLAVVGGKRLHRALRQASAAGAQRVVQFTGPVDDPTPFYAAADAYVQPTFYDPCSLVALESMACGLPLVTSRYNGVSELMTGTDQGYVLQDPADVEELESRLELLMSAERRQQMSVAARQLAMRHTFARNVDEIVALYEHFGHRRAAA